MSLIEREKAGGLNAVVKVPGGKPAPVSRPTPRVTGSSKLNGNDSEPRRVKFNKAQSTTNVKGAKDEDFEDDPIARSLAQREKAGGLNAVLKAEKP